MPRPTPAPKNPHFGVRSGRCRRSEEWEESSRTGAADSATKRWDHRSRTGTRQRTVPQTEEMQTMWNGTVVATRPFNLGLSVARAKQTWRNGTVFATAINLTTSHPRIEDGGCTRLVAFCLRSAGARFDEATLNWGKQIAWTTPSSRTLNGIMPGDVLQFTNAKFESANQWTLLGTPNHTAIVGGVNGQQIQLIQQNAPLTSGVHVDTINLAEMTAGQIIAYRPQGP